MHQAYLELNGVRTKVSTWGKWVEESTKDTEDIVIIITGNPGISGFYDLFAETINEKLGYPVWCLGHAGHDLPKEPITLPKFNDHKELYGLKGQIQHKVLSYLCFLLIFFEKYVPINTRVHLIGHSIGCYMILELLEHPSIKDKVSDVHLLFPTIEHMAETKNGKFLTTFIKPIVWLIVFVSWIFTILPNIIQFILIYAYMTFTGISIEEHFKNVKAIVNPGVLRRVFFLAFEELDQVKERNNEVIKSNINKLKLYYGKNDGWAPASFCDRIKIDIPNINAQVSSYDHTFVLKRNVEVGNIVSDWIKAKQ
ncbi:hypothetical protein NQ314_013012 [Rhamnusium bicolor]|uniref:Lipid droplet-associated hydrolase n=1 Tax=Rhamnusium bicolor TaxID=1586634 RepID=A0AAV8X9G5_9CUCU|nr:hypothetical protein NQ314_013012 [Rhamnusium bicolor]